MNSKTVVIIENEENQRKPLLNALERRGFRVVTAGTVSEARRMLPPLAKEIDVMVLDMGLDDPDDPDVTGADLAIEFRRQFPHSVVEYLINTVYANEVNFHKLALRLGAASYLSKQEVKRDDVVRHVRALALKRSLRHERTEVMETLSSISVSTKNLPEAVKKFCCELLASELNACLGTPYILLLSDGRGTQSIAANLDLPLGRDRLYDAMQAVAHATSNFALPQIISEQEISALPRPSGPAATKVLGRLAGAAFLPLANVKGFKLSLALFTPLPGESPYAEDTGKLAAVLAQYVRPVIVEYLLSILVHLDSHKRAMLKSISSMCLSIGHNQQRIIDDALLNRDLREGSDSHRSLATMANDLWQTGTIISSAANRDADDTPPPLEMRGLVDRAAEDLRGALALDAPAFRVEGLCRVWARRDDMYIVIKRLLQWLAQRRAQTPPHVRPEIHVLCAETVEGSLVTFEDQSARLPEKLRRHLFEPFSTQALSSAGAADHAPGLHLPLYMAKILVEEKYDGWLDDKSDELKGTTGHRFVMRFNRAGDDAASGGAVGV